MCLPSEPEPSPLAAPKLLGVTLEGLYHEAHGPLLAEDPPLHFTYLCVGGGNATGYWAFNLVRELQERGVAERSIAVVSTYPVGMLPYERPALTKGALNPDNTELRRVGSAAFPFTMKGSGGAALNMEWWVHKGRAAFLGLPLSCNRRWAL